MTYCAHKIIPFHMFWNLGYTNPQHTATVFITKRTFDPFCKILGATMLIG